MQVNYMGYDQRNEVLDLSKNIKKSIRKYFEDKNIDGLGEVFFKEKL